MNMLLLPIRDEFEYFSQGEHSQKQSEAQPPFSSEGKQLLLTNVVPCLKQIFKKQKHGDEATHTAQAV